ncbi:MAG: hypothetical protein H0W84_08715 [Bacteroidetes bacterium]|nr:hypothetical protein [Bacteroidota bacterium]
MLLSLPVLILLIIVSISGCSNNDPVTPSTGEVLLASVPGDSVGIQSGTSSKTISIGSGLLDFTDRDSARISFYYSGDNNTFTEPFQIFFNSGPGEVFIYNGSNLNILPAEQFANITIPSPKNSQFYSYRIRTTSTGFSYFKFRDLKLYKK